MDQQATILWIVHRCHRQLHHRKNGLKCCAEFAKMECRICNFLAHLCPFLSFIRVSWWSIKGLCKTFADCCSSIFTGQMPFLIPKQQYQSIICNDVHKKIFNRYNKYPPYIELEDLLDTRN